MMEWIYSSADQTIPKIKGINSHMSLWPVNAKMDRKFVINRGGSHQSRSSGYEPLPTPGLVHTVGDGFSTPIMIAGRSRTMLQNRYSNSNSKNISYGSRGSSPLSAIEILDKLSPSMLRTPPGFSTSVKDDEDVLMMDGILVGGMMRFAMESGGSSSSSTSSAYNFFKTELCRSWEDSGSCRFGSKCQFAHGKEELRPTHFPIKEVQICKSNATTVVCTYGTNCSFFHPVTTAAESAAATGHTASSVKVEKGSRGIISITGRMWSPQDDGIEITLPSSIKKPPATLPSSIKKPPATEHVDICIQAVLYDATPRRRLQVIAEICPDHSHLAHSY